MLRVGLAVVLLALSGCSSADNGGAQPVPQTSTKDPVTIVVARTGGFAGVMDTITVRPDATWTHPTALTTTGKLDPAKFAALQVLATDPRLATEAATTSAPTNCNDAFDYTVTAGALTITFTDCPSDAYQPVVTKQLVDLVQKAVSP